MHWIQTIREHLELIQAESRTLTIGKVVLRTPIYEKRKLDSLFNCEEKSVNFNIDIIY
jgi:hypothetical protein